MLFDYASVRRALTEQESFSSGMAAAGRTNPEWKIFLDPPRHGKLRGLISKAFTPNAIADVEMRIRGLSRQLLDAAAKNGCMDVVGDYATPLPMMVIAEMIGIPVADWSVFRGWSDGILRLSQTIMKADAGAVSAYAAVKSEMAPYLKAIVARRRVEPQDDLLTRLVRAEFEGERLTEQEIAGFIELLIVAGQETTSNLVANAVITFAEHPDQRRELGAAPELLPSAIEEVLRYRSPVQWLFRSTVREVHMCGQTIPAGNVVIPVIGAANRDPHILGSQIDF